MNQRLEKRIPIRLAAQDYKKLRQRVLRRDGWRCQFCGSRQNLEVHHQQFRSRCGGDVEGNLITLCNDCDSSYHGARRRLIRKDLMRS
jgi:5-methylcytosine-specific restriction endonuclease McrA